MIQVTGTHTDPIGTPIASKEIRVTTVSSEFSTEGVVGVLLTGSGGEYDFNLELGNYLIEVNQNKEYTLGVYVDTTTAPSVITLAALLNGYAYTPVL